MNYKIKTVYQPEDLNGLYNAFLLGKKHMRISKKISRIISIVLAVVFWGVAAIALISAIAAGIEKTGMQGIQIVLACLPITVLFLLLGFLTYSSGHSRFKSRWAWKSYPFKNIEIEYVFYPDKYTVSQPASEATNEYSLITRIFEDEKRFYLFTSPRTAHILPKRDFQENVDSFRSDIIERTGLNAEVISF